MLKDGDISLICSHCGKEFVFTKAEQDFYQEKGFAFPRRCKKCRLVKQKHHMTCCQCGIELDDGASLYCANCLENARLEFELKTKKVQKATNEVYAKLRNAESEKAELENSLRQKEQELAKLEQQFDSISRDLDKAIQFHTALSWLQPALEGMNKALAGIKARIEGLEQAQNRLSERVPLTLQRIQEMQQNITLLQIIKQSLRHHPKHSTKVTSP